MAPPPRVQLSARMCSGFKKKGPLLILGMEAIPKLEDQDFLDVKVHLSVDRASLMKQNHHGPVGDTYVILLSFFLYLLLRVSSSAVTQHRDGPEEGGVISACSSSECHGTPRML